MFRFLVLLVLLVLPAPTFARTVVEASEPSAISVTVYRDPLRTQGERMERDWPQGFAMISETRRVVLPPGPSTIRFVGVAEGMVAVSAIVTGLPGGTIEKNRNADVLSPAALVDGMLGNRVTITRTDPADGSQQSEPAIVRTRADGGLVLQTRDGFEAVRCSGLPETLTFDRVPTGLVAAPVFTIDTSSADGGTYDVVLTYLAWGFDWDAHYVAWLGEGSRDGAIRFDLMSWLTVLNDNGQSFADAELLAVAGTLNIESDFEGLSDLPAARPLRLTCYPLGSTAQGTLVPPPPPPPSLPSSAIMVTGTRIASEALESAAPVAMMAGEEELGALKLYRVPEPVTLAAKSAKQVAFLDRDEVEGRLVYRVSCSPDQAGEDFELSRILLEAQNREARGLGQSLPMGGISVFERGEWGELLVASSDLRDLAVGREIELDLGISAQVSARCSAAEQDVRPGRWTRMTLMLSNANPVPVTVRIDMGRAADWDAKGMRGLDVKNGRRIAEVILPANATRTLRYRMRRED